MSGMKPLSMVLETQKKLKQSLILAQKDFTRSGIITNLGFNSANLPGKDIL